MASSSPPTAIAVPSGNSSQNLLLDSDIRDWVVLPLLVIMISAGLLRHYLGQLLRAKSSTICLIEARSKSCLQRSSRLRAGGAGYITRTKFEGRRRYMSHKEVGLLREEATRAQKDGELAKAAAVDNMNPMSMMDGMKGNMAFMVQNMVMMQGISHFFKGFVLVKVPFPLTNGFKMMFQRGLDLSTLETSYVSSVSWYFMVMFGLRAFFKLVIGDMSQELQESNMLQMSFGNLSMAAAPGQQFNAPNVLKAEADNLEMVRYKSIVDGAEKRLLGKKYPRKKLLAGSNPGDDIFGYGTTTKKKEASSRQKKKQ